MALDARRKQKKAEKRNAKVRAKQKVIAQQKAAGWVLELPYLPPLDDDRLRCGLCGKTTNLTKTECCGNGICDDEHTYRLFSFVRNSCHRNHSRFTLCGYHHANGHDGRWQDCQKCREDIDETEMYVWYATNEYNFEKLQNPPKFKPTLCADCGRRISLGEEGYMVSGEKYYCQRCTPKHGGLRD